MSGRPPSRRLTGDRSTLTARALEALRAAIVDGRLEAGERYSVAQLAERFGVSRTPVREALLVLERQGVVRFERNRGVRVLETTAHDLEEVFALRLLLEVPATRRACALLSATTSPRSSASSRRWSASPARPTRPRSWPTTSASTRSSCARSGNRRLTTIVSQLRDLVRFRGASTVGRSRDLQAILAEHVVILDALRARDADARRRGDARAPARDRPRCCSPRRARRRRACRGPTRSTAERSRRRPSGAGER